MKTLFAIMVGFVALAGCGKTHEQVPKVPKDEKEAAPKHIEAAPKLADGKLTGRLPWNTRYGIEVHISDDLVRGAKIVKYSGNGEIADVPQSTKTTNGQINIVFDEHNAGMIGVANYYVRPRAFVRDKSVFVTVSDIHVEVRRRPGAVIFSGKTQPVLEYWDGGIYMIGKPPSVQFAVWADGMVVKKVGRKTMVGFVGPGAISKLIEAVKKAGFFTPSGDSGLDEYGMVFVDGPVRCLSAMNGGKRRTLRYHERYDFNNFDKIGPTASPSRRHREQFVATWIRVVAEIEKITPDTLKLFTGDRPLVYPK